MFTIDRFLDTQKPEFTKDIETLQNIIPHGKGGSVKSEMIHSYWVEWAGLPVCSQRKIFMPAKNIGGFLLLVGMRFSPYQLKVSCLKLGGVLLNPACINSLEAAL